MVNPDNSQRLDHAISLAQSGQPRQAEIQLRQLVAAGSRLPRATMALGVLCGERGDLAERRLWLRQARHLEDASGDPPSLRLLLNLLVDALEHGEPDQALAYGSEALLHHPEEWEAHVCTAQACFALGDNAAALPHLTEGRRLLLTLSQEDPAALKGWRMLARTEHKADRRDPAIEAYGRALAIDPNHLPCLLAISRLLINGGAIDAAMPWLMNALAVAPDNPEVLGCNAYALKSLGEIEQAIELFRKALVIDPTDADCSLFLGNTLRDIGLFDEAAKVYEDALVHSPGHRECSIGLGNNLLSKGDVKGALKILNDFREREPEDLELFRVWMFATSISNLVPPQDVLASAQRFWNRKDMAAGMSVVPRTVPSAPETGQPLRVGLLSGDIGHHVVGRFLDPLLRHHDSARCRLEIISLRRFYDRESEELVGLADCFHSLEGLPVDLARAKLREQAYDLIVDTSGHTRGSGLHLLAERCAPLQAHYIGYHATTGLDTMDGFIGDEETAAPELQDQFCEQLWRLPRPWLAYPKEPVFPEATALMKTDRPVFGSFAQISKINAATLEFWAAALRRVPEAFLVLKSSGMNDPGMRKHLEQQLVDRGVASNRLNFLAPVGTWWDHVDHYNILDVALDTTPWSSATTGFEALAMGVPLIAIRGNCMASRMSSSLVKGLGRNEWIGETPEQIAEIAAHLCADLPNLRAKKQELQQKTLASTLFDGHDLSNQVVRLFENMVQQRKI